MFHIKHDKRSQTSANLIVEGLFECMRTKNFSEITITDLQKVSSVSRTTFYRLFDKISDVFEFQCEKIFEKTVTEGKNFSKHDTRIKFFELCQENLELLKNIISSNNIEIIYKVYGKYFPEIKK